METLLTLCMGIGLSAACGFRVFVPPLVMSMAALSGHLSLSPDFAWIGTWPAFVTFAVATALEIGAYYVPWLDNLLDSIATPTAIVAGTIVTAAFVTDLSPFMKWTLAAVAGGGVAALVQGATVSTRAVSSAGTGGLANPVLATVELGGSVLTSALALLAPLVAVGLLVVAAVVLIRKLLRRRTAAQAPTIP